MSKLKKKYYRFISWRLLKSFTGKVAQFSLPAFVVANTALAVIPDLLFDWLGGSIWKLIVHWIGFLFVIAAFIRIHRKQPAELKSGTDGGKIASKFESTLDWSRFHKTKQMLKKTMEEAEISQPPGIEGKETLQANLALEASNEYNDQSTREQLKATYRSLMVARYDLLIYFEPDDRKISGRRLIVGCGLMVLPHLYHFISVFLSAVIR